MQAKNSDHPKIIDHCVIISERDLHFKSLAHESDTKAWLKYQILVYSISDTGKNCILADEETIYSEKIGEWKPEFWKEVKKEDNFW